FRSRGLADEQVFSNRVDVSGDLDGLTNLFNHGGVQLIDRREVVLGIGTVELVLQWSTVFCLCFWSTQWLKAKGGDTFGNFIGVPANQLTLRINPHIIYA